MSEQYRVIVMGRGGKEVLLVPNGERHMLPWVEIPRWQRAAENLTVAVKTDWGEKVVCLFEPATEPRTDCCVPSYYAAEHLRTCGIPKIPTRWLPLSMLSQRSLIEAQECAAVKQVVAVCKGEVDGPSAGPFARLGWFSELRNWIETVIEPIGFRISGEFQQLNASPSFSLMRFETSGPALWFKAVGEPNQREFPITSMLAEICPAYLPPILATCPEWNGWLCREAQGDLLSEVREQVRWEQAAATLAKLQIESIDRCSAVLCAGAHDLGSASLSKHIQSFPTVAAQLMERQTKVPPPVLDSNDLLAVAESLQSAVDAAKATCVPETIGHLDLNPGNVIVSRNGCQFLDWAGAYVGNPMFSLEYLREQAKRTFGPNSAVGAGLTDAYCRQWEGVISSAAMNEALALAPLLAVFSYAVSSGTWNASEKIDESGAAGYLRSLVRRMHRESLKLSHHWVPIS